VVSAGWVGSALITGHDELFKKVLEGQSIISDVMLTRENIPFVYLAVPIFHLGKVTAVLWSELNLKAVWDVIKGIDIGRTGQVYIMDSDGRLIGDRDMVHVVRTPTMVQPEVLSELLKPEHPPLPWTEKRDGAKLFCLGKGIPSLRWIVVLSQLDAETYAYLYQNFHWSVGIIFFVSLTAIMLCWFLMRLFLRPIHELHHRVQKIGEGELDQKVEIHHPDEIGDLSVAFNRMADSLKTYINREIETARELAHARNLSVLGAASSKVTHEVGNLLSNIEITMYTLKLETLSEGGSVSLEMLGRESGRVRAFIRNFLQFAKKPELNLQKIPLESTFRDIMMLQGPRSASRSIDIELDWPADLPDVFIDAHLMYQVFNNLIKNGLEAMTGPGRIRIAGEVEGDQLRITMEDTGSGMDQDIQEKIFEPFFSTKGDKGTGLGLPICKSIVEAHGGKIECRSQPGRGTLFILYLPLRRPFGPGPEPDSGR